MIEELSNKRIIQHVDTWGFSSGGISACNPIETDFLREFSSLDSRNAKKIFELVKIILNVRKLELKTIKHQISNKQMLYKFLTPQ